MSRIPLFFSNTDFSPADLSGLRLWLDAATINQANGSSVVTWGDKSGNNAQFSVNATTNRPTYQTNIIGTKPVIRFDGVDDYLELTYPFDRRPNIAINAVSFSPDGNFLAATLSNNSPYLWLFQRSGDTFEYLSSAVNTQPTGASRTLRWSPNGIYLAVPHSTSPFVSVYKFNSTNKTLTKLSNPTTLPPGTGVSCCWTSDSATLFVACNSGTGNRLLTYSLSNDVLTHQSNGQIQSNTLSDVAISSNDNHVAVTYTNASPRIELYTYNKNTYQLTSLGVSQPNVVPTGGAEKCAFSPNGNFLAVTHSTSPFLSVYQITSGPTYTKLTNPTTLPSATGVGVAWTSDSKYLVVGSTGTVGSSAYELKFDVQTSSWILDKLTTPNQLTIPTVNQIAISANDTHVAMATSAGQFLQVYSHSAGVFTPITRHGIFKNVSGSTVFVVYRESSYPAVSQHLFSVSTGISNTNPRLTQAITTSGFLSVQGRTGDNDTTAVSTSAAPYLAIGSHISTGLFTNSTGTISSYIDGVLSKTETGFTGLTLASTADTDSRLFYLGQSLGGVFASVDIAEVIAYNRALTSGEIAQVHSFLQAKYFIADPRQLNGLQLWLDASTINQADGTAVTTWADLSGNGYNAAQATTTAQPTFKTNIQNGLGVVRFDGVDDFLSLSTGLGMLNNVAGATIILVVKYPNNSIINVPFHVSTTLNNVSRMTLLVSDQNKYEISKRRVDGESSVNVTSTSSTTTNFVIHTGVSDYSSSVLTQYINGSLDGRSFAGSSGNTSATNSAAINVGRAGSLGYYLNGDICEILVYNRALSQTELTTIHRHLGRKWGITLA